MAESKKNQTLINKLKQSNHPLCDIPEFQKMVSGMYFSAGSDSRLAAFKFDVLKKVRQFNSVPIESMESLADFKKARMAIAETIIGRMGENVDIVPPLTIEWGVNTTIGNTVYINKDTLIEDNAPVGIGNGVLIGPRVSIITAMHDHEASARDAAFGTSFARAIRIEDDCWICAGAKILPGVTVGKGSLVMAGAVVSKDVPAYSAVGGVPAKVVRNLNK